MRTSCAAIVMGLALTLVATHADAEPSKRVARKGTQESPASAQVRDQQRAAKSESIEDVRANSLDPAGNYKGYPSWARSAFGGPYGSGGRD